MYQSYYIGNFEDGDDEMDPDFTNVKSYMESKGYDWHAGEFEFYKWADGKRIDSCSFEEAVTEWRTAGYGGCDD